MADDEEDVPKAEEASRDQQQQNRALDSITDHHGEDDRQLDSRRVEQAMASLTSQTDADRQRQRLREKELAAVKIKPGDVDVIAAEFEVDKKVAERTLREHKGNAIAALRSMLQ
eukprot:TRINITY_DN27047_c0_g1_i1.p3 TRINITY_DN27047_c0_g1~~TRINITY_DN27047_c0_g1_i1.p3  ORF type:complete len:114 (+),score=40.44 TRINITY_DN27047_c0_g1_i1:93-434(+)